ncbi:MAG TPA: hypothetical protein VGA79_01685 [Desulfobaccales bacterium]
MCKDGKLGLKTALGFLVVTGALHNLKNTLADPDLWGYLAFGRLWWETGKFPYQDVFSYVPTLSPWIYHEWLTGVLFYPLYQSLGAPGLQLARYTLGLAAAGLVYLTARKRGADPLAAALGLWGAQLFLALGYSPVRAQVFTYGFFALYLYILEGARHTRNWRSLWLLVPIQAVWCNLHGGFVAGLGLIALYALGEGLSRRPWRPYAEMLVLAALATLINPYGPAYWKYLVRAVLMPRPEITEWASLLEAYRQGIISGQKLSYFLTLVAFGVALGWWARWRDLTAALALAVTFCLGWRHQRHLVFFLLLAGAYFPLLLTAYLAALRSRAPVAAACARVGRRLPCLGAVVLALTLGYGFLNAAPWSIKTPAQPGTGVTSSIYYPVGAADYIRQRRLSGKLLLEFNWGEYAIWELFPRCRVALDGRYETVYADEVAAAYFEFIDGRPGWQDFLRDYPPDLVLVDSRSRIYALLLGADGWRLLYADPGCALFVRSLGGGGQGPRAPAALPQTLTPQPP